MQPVRPAVAPGVPAYLVTRPQAGTQVIARPLLWSRLEQLVGTHRVVLLVAPAGYGKTTALSTWADHTAKAVGWLSLTEADRHSEHLSRGLSAALADLHETQEAAAAPGGPDAVLVIDDVHLADSAAARQILVPFVEHGPPGVRIVLSGRSEAGLRLTRLAAAGELARLTAEDLSFSADEVDLVGRAIGRPISSDRAGRLRLRTGGWPVAVRLALLTPSSPTSAPALPTDGPDIPQLPEYLIENVLDVLPADLRDFVLCACTCDWLTGAVADALSGGGGGAANLELAIAAGLPLERRGSFAGDPVYRWHPLMAHAGGAVLLRRDPERFRDLHSRAARALGALDPIEAASHALRGRDPALAANLIRSQWLAAVLRGDSDLLAELCGRLPSAQAADPEILAIRAACLRNIAEAPVAQELDHRALMAAADLPADRQRAFELTRQLARLFVLDDSAELAVASTQAQASVNAFAGMDGTLRACALLLLGWTELRLRQALPALPLLREAAQLCLAEGLDDLAERARANFGFALAFVGDFPAAQEAITSTHPADSSARWRRADGAIEWFTIGWIRYWSGDPTAAMDAFQHVVDQGGGLISYSQLARCWLLDAAIEADHPSTISLLEPMLSEVPEHTVQGLPWTVYRAIVRAGVLVASDSLDQAAQLLDEVIPSEPGTPAANAQAAELYWRCGRVEAAREQAGLLLGALPDYLKISGLVVTALCEQRDGRPVPAHALIEQALALGAPHALLRAFNRPDPALLALLAEHAAWGTSHEAFLADALARQHLAVTGISGRLSAREREVLGRLHTAMTAVEIAAELHISPNTLKTHLKSIYRKLAVDNRREAVRVSRGRQA
ncbi:MAG: hypothetical protein IPO80_09650 [Propionibacteriaceae bacterium]|nr:hypothetical protein [Propionibacteriaceae bacterium]